MREEGAPGFGSGEGGAGEGNGRGGGEGAVDPVRLEVFRQLLSSVAEEMGMVLRRTSYSPNIKERRDFSCAVFDRHARMVAQAAHIPVHLGSMPLSVRACVDRLDLGPGDVAVLNDPFRGGTHLPDITLVAPVLLPPGNPGGGSRSDSGGGTPSDSGGGTAEGKAGDRRLLGYVAARAHHADVGGMTPGSMPLARELYQEGLVVPPVRLVRGGRLQEEMMDLLLANVRTPEEREGDLRAQMAAVRKGERRMAELAGRYGTEELERYMGALLGYAERTVRELLRELPDGAYRFRDVMEDDGWSDEPAEIVVEVRVTGDEATVDFTGTAEQREGSINAVYPITLSAVFYVFRSLVGHDIPSNSGCLVPIEVVAPEGSLVNARPPAAVAGGNVETSQRIVDVLLGALSGACPDRIPAASQGTMNNVTVGGAHRGGRYAYYETVAGGVGGRPGKAGASGVHSHMTNTMNTPVEALEYAYPLRVRRYAIRRGSGGDGRFPGGDGLIRELEVLGAARITLLTERRKRPPYGLAGGEPGARGRNLLLRGKEERLLPGKGSLDAEAGDVLRIETPGGGGWGEPQ